MRHITYISLLGLFFLPGISNAASPYNFGEWSVDGAGQIADQNGAGVACPTGAQCNVIIRDRGFLQQEVRPLGNGPNPGSNPIYHIQTIITDPNATGPAAGVPMFNESYVRVDRTAAGQANPTQGIAAKQQLTGGAEFSSSTDILTGWANAGEDSVVINQRMNDPNAAAGEEFATSFLYQSTNAAIDGARIDYFMDIRQVTGLLDPAGGNAATDKQAFALQQGNRTAGGGTVTLSPGTAASGPGGTVTWNAGDEVRVTWLGQTITPNTVDQFFTGSIFGYEGVTNVTANSSAVWIADDATGPVQWPTITGMTVPDFNNFTVPLP